METRTCKDCLKEKPIAEFVPRSRPRRGTESYCRPCKNARAAVYRARNPEMHKLRNLTYRQNLRQSVLDAYGNQCACCGETHPEFLAMDHINGGGNRERKSKANNTSQGMYRIARDAGFPKDKFQLLCHNCNCSIGWYGYCPHQKEK